MSAVSYDLSPVLVENATWRRPTRRLGPTRRPGPSAPLTGFNVNREVVVAQSFICRHVTTCLLSYGVIVLCLKEMIFNLVLFSSVSFYI